MNNQMIKTKKTKQISKPILIVHELNEAADQWDKADIRLAKAYKAFSSLMMNKKKLFKEIELKEALKRVVRS